jgi:hypothetical protein
MTHEERVIEEARNIAPKSTEERRLIEFAKGVLEFIERDQDCGADTIGDIVALACELCLADVIGEIDESEVFRTTLEGF